MDLLHAVEAPPKLLVFYDGIGDRNPSVINGSFVELWSFRCWGRNKRLQTVELPVTGDPHDADVRSL